MSQMWRVCALLLLLVHTISAQDDLRKLLYEVCTPTEFECLARAERDHYGLDAIKTLHTRLDDDADGAIDLAESDDFLRGELQYAAGGQERRKVFHRNDNDGRVSVRELWEQWLRSDVHNWTVAQCSEWLTTAVDLPQYATNFAQHGVMGARLPRLAANNHHYLTAIGIKDPIHKHKISLKAMDVVLFGAPKEGQAGWKDITLIALSLAGGLGVWFALRQKRRLSAQLVRMNRDMDSLQTAERALDALQRELEQAKAVGHRPLTPPSPSSHAEEELSQLRAEVEMLRAELQIAEGELRDCGSQRTAPHQLQQWLQLTYEMENRAYVKKKMAAEKQLQQAREACEKLRKKRSSVVAAFVSTHGKSIDDVDRSIVEARTSLNEVTQELQERVHRWNQIEMLCGCALVTNQGISALERALYRGRPGFAAANRIGSARDESDEDSDTSRLEEESSSAHGPVQFVIGAGESFEEKRSKTTISPRSVSNNEFGAVQKQNMVRSFSQDTNLTSTSTPSEPLKKLGHFTSDSSLKKNFGSIEEDVCSTDSSLIEDVVDGKKPKKRKLFSFAKNKNKSKND